MEEPYEFVKGGSGFRRALKELPIRDSFFLHVHCKIWSAGAMNQLTQRDQFKSSRLLLASLQLSVFLGWALCQSWQPFYSVVDLKRYPLAQSAPFSKSATTSSFQIEKNSGSRLPILKLKTDSFLERLQLSFPASENMKAGENVQKIAVKSGVHTENDRFFRIFEFKKTVFILPYIPQSKA